MGVAGDRHGGRVMDADGQGGRSVWPIRVAGPNVYRCTVPPWAAPLQRPVLRVMSGGVAQSSPRGGRRSRLVALLRAFDSLLRTRSEGGTRVATRGVTGRRRISMACRSRASATDRFRCWLRSSRAVTTIPVGRWVSRTALSVTFWCCPPGPPARKVSTRHWASSSRSSAGGGSGRGGGTGADGGGVASMVGMDPVEPQRVPVGGWTPRRSAQPRSALGRPPAPRARIPVSARPPKDFP
jgi:hypothetical protein